jgi:hypothetical protein
MLYDALSPEAAAQLRHEAVAVSMLATQAANQLETASPVGRLFGLFDAWAQAASAMRRSLGLPPEDIRDTAERMFGQVTALATTGPISKDRLVAVLSATAEPPRDDDAMAHAESIHDLARDTADPRFSEDALIDRLDNPNAL